MRISLKSAEQRAVKARALLQQLGEAGKGLSGELGRRWDALPFQHPLTQSVLIAFLRACGVFLQGC